MLEGVEESRSFIANTLPKFQELVDRVRTESEKAGLFLHAKTKNIMNVLRQAAEGEVDRTTCINGEKIENVKKFTYLGAVSTNRYDDTPEIKRRIAIAKNAVVSLTKIWKDKGICLIPKEIAIFSSFFNCVIWFRMLGIRGVR